MIILIYCGCQIDLRAFTERVFTFKTLEASPRNDFKSLTLFNLTQHLKNVVVVQTIDLEAHVYREQLLKSAPCGAQQRSV